jgi:hypothetical protein
MLNKQPYAAKLVAAVLRQHPFLSQQNSSAAVATRLDQPGWIIFNTSDVVFMTHCIRCCPAGIQDIDELVAAFNAAEDANYTLFNYVNEVNTEVEALEDNIERVRQEIDAYMAQVGSAVQNMQQRKWAMV